ncbi:MAG: MFS transporter [Verrucomicrobiales bacterium]
MPADTKEAVHLRDISPQQWRSGLAAWLGWLFDGLDMHLYTLVATPFVAQLLGNIATGDVRVGQHASIIQAAFLVGWALGGAFFGRIGDLLGRSRTLVLTILTYAAFTGLSAISQEWWHLMIFRFLSALGIGGEWAVGASLLAETWPKHWRPWIAATLQSAVNIGVLMACLAGWAFAGQDPRWIFVVGVLPALITLWIRRAVPEPEKWAEARHLQKPPRVSALFGAAIRSTTWRVLVICAVSLTAHWAFMFWQQAHIRNHPAIKTLSAADKNNAAVIALTLVMAGSICGNFIAGAFAKLWGYRKAVALTLLAYGGAMFVTFVQPWSYSATLALFTVVGVCQGVFGLFTMCLPPLFPTLLRTTGAGFCYNIGRIVAAGGTVFFGIYARPDDVREALFFAGFLFLPAAFLALWLPERQEDAA